MKWMLLPPPGRSVHSADIGGDSRLCGGSWPAGRSHGSGPIPAIVAGSRDRSDGQSR